MKVHYLLHIPEEQPAGVALWAQSRNHTQSSTSFYKDEALPAINDFDLLVIMGGSMNVYQEDKYPWLKREKDFIKQAIKANKKVLGICLGAQLLADALGAEVVRNDQLEIGWFPIELTAAGLRHSAFSELKELPKVVHWHGDKFKVPPGAQLLASSKACDTQAFSYQDNILALQFHIEMTEEALQSIVKLDENILIKADYVQTKEAIASDKTLLPACNEAFFAMMDKFTETSA